MKKIILERMTRRLLQQPLGHRYRWHRGRRFCANSREWRHELHRAYLDAVKESGVERVANHCPESVTPEEWAILCARFALDAFKIRSVKNVANRAKLPFNHISGRKCFVQNRHERGELDMVDFYRDTHYVPGKEGEEGHWISNYLRTAHERMTELRSSQQFEPSSSTAGDGATSLHPDQIAEQVLGKRPGYVRGLGKGHVAPHSMASAASQSSVHDGTPWQQDYDVLIERLTTETALRHDLECHVAELAAALAAVQSAIHTTQAAATPPTQTSGTSGPPTPPPDAAVAAMTTPSLVAQSRSEPLPQTYPLRSP